MAALVSDLITKVKQRINLPDSSPTSSDATLLSFMQEELEETVYPKLYALNEQFFIVSQKFDCQTNGSPNFPNSLMPFPTRAYGRSINLARYWDLSNNAYLMSLVNEVDYDLFRSNKATASMNSGAPAYIVQNDGILILCEPSVLNGKIELTYAVRTPTLVSNTSASSAATITNVVYNSGTTTITMTPGSAFDTYMPNPTTAKSIDIFRKSTGSWYDLDVICARTGANTLTTTHFTQDDVTELNSFQKGGFSSIPTYAAELILTPSEQINYTPIPPEADNYLILATCGRYLESVGDTEGLQVNETRMDKTYKTMIKSLGTRVINAPKPIVNRRGLKAYFTPSWARRY